MTPLPFILRGDPDRNAAGEQVWLEPDHRGGHGPVAAVFPYGFSASFAPMLVLRDGDGIVVAREGDTLDLAGSGDPMRMCGISVVNGEPRPRASFRPPPEGMGMAVISTCDDAGTGIGPFRIEFVARDRPRDDPQAYIEVFGNAPDCGAQTYQLPAGRWDFGLTPGDRSVDGGKGGRFELSPNGSVEWSLVLHRNVPGDGVGAITLVVCGTLGKAIPYTLVFSPSQGQAPEPLTFRGVPDCDPVLHDLASGRWHVEASSPGYRSSVGIFEITTGELARASLPLDKCRIVGCPTPEPSPP